MSHLRSNPRVAAGLLPDGRRMHLSDGPMDLIVGADGPAEIIGLAYRVALTRFSTMLDELCAELPLLRRHAEPAGRPYGAVSRRMWEAVLPHAGDAFITPMAAVAGAVAEAVLQAMTTAAPLGRAYVNNGGDIAVHLAPGQHLRAGMVDRPDRPALAGIATVTATDGVRGIATSGWRGRSFSLGIADAVTILAADAPAADACATVVANAVDLPGHPAVRRRPADGILPDSDLRDRLVTVAVGALSAAEIDAALRPGVAMAERLCAEGRIAGAVLRLAGETRLVGTGRFLEGGQ